MAHANAAAHSRSHAVLNTIPLARTCTLFLALLLFLAGCDGDSAKKSGNITVEYATESGSKAEAVVDSPLKVQVRVPWSDGSQEGTLAEVAIDLLDEEGNPAVIGGQKALALLLRPTLDIAVWEHVGSVPSEPGAYHVRVHWKLLFGDNTLQSLELQEPVLTAVEEPGDPLRSGYVFAAESNLWMLSTDTSRQRRLTFFPAYYEYADKPRWSPSGDRIAFTYSPTTDRSQLPATDIWAINADRTGLEELVKHGEGETVYDPAWSPDGKYIYFTVETGGMSSAPGDPSMVPITTHRVDRVELATGTRTEWASSALMPAPGSGGDVFYLEELVSEEPENAGAVVNRLVKSSAAGQSGTTLVDERAYQGLYAPSVSPNGKWVVFSAVNPVEGDAGMDLLEWLKPLTARAHGLPWDVYLIPASGGTPTRLTQLAEDQPFPAWLDDRTIGFMGITGLYKLNIDASGKAVGEPDRIHNGAPHGGLTWHAP